MNLTLSNFPTSHQDYALLSPIRDEIVRRSGGLAELRQAFPLLVREAIDSVLDSVKTAKTSVSDLDNVEKTFLGLKLEHNLRDMLDVPKQLRDLHIAGKDVDIKNTVGSNWMIPKETYDEEGICLLMRIDTANHRCWLGLVVCRDDYLNPGMNRDGKRSISAAGKENIMWLVTGEHFHDGYFVGIDMDRFRHIRKANGSGNETAAAFFRENIGRVVNRRVVESLLYKQRDPMKRLRANGGASDVLAADRIAILIGTYSGDRDAAARFGFPHLKSDEIVAVQAQTDEEWKVLSGVQ